MTRLVLFDIDGTLIATGGAGVRAMTAAFEELFQVPDAFRTVPVRGRTDQIILAAALDAVQRRLDAGLLDRFRQRYCARLREEMTKPGPRKGVMPGVPDLLGALAARPDVFLALLTGNFAEAARIKLEYFGLWHHFACGAYGDDAGDRNALVPVAVARARACGLPEMPPADVVVVGDTPLDVACARAAGAAAVAVATGGFSVEALQASGPDLVLEDLSNPAGFLDWLDGR